MAQGLGTSQQLVQTQKLSPLQIQTIKLLEKPFAEIQESVIRELEDNIVVDESVAESARKERDEDKKISLDNSQDDKIPGYNMVNQLWGKDPRPERNTLSDKQSFIEALYEQLGYVQLTEEEEVIGRYIIGSLDGNGYLRRDAETLTDDMSFRNVIQTNVKVVEKVISCIQGFDPPGVCARSLIECLLLQLRRKKPTESVRHATTILEHYGKQFLSKDFKYIMRRMSLSDEQFKSVLKLLCKLNPKPGGAGDDEVSEVITPDFKLVEREDGSLSFEMPKINIPEIRYQSYYVELLQKPEKSLSREEAESVKIVKRKMDSLKQFIEALKQRKNTLEKTMQAILDYQYDFFLSGDESDLRPMVLKDIAKVTSFDISTISRVANLKYIETSFGVFPLKFFFSEGLENAQGEEVSTREVKKALKELVDGENKRDPLTDEELMDELKKRGYKVARRTIAKYRSQLDIPSARMRVEI